MTKKELLQHVDHTILKPIATWEDIKQEVDKAIKFDCASICISPCYVGMAKKYIGNKIKICTVIGFPLGYQSLFIKKEEALQAIRDGADELDIVINISQLKSGNYHYIRGELRQIKNACNVLTGSMKNKAPIVFKVIIETSLLTKKEIKEVSKIISDLGFDYIKTSTGFFVPGAELEDIKIIKDVISPNIKIKASGGISTFEEAEEFLRAGCDRIGSSKLLSQ